MKKSTCIFFLLWLAPVILLAQQDVQRLYSQIKNPFIKVEDVDVVANSLRKIQSAGLDSSQRQILFETYRIAAERYVANNHFKQAYILYDDYLAIKEKALASERASAISTAIKQQTGKQQLTKAEISSIESELTVLETNEKQLESRSSNFIRNVSLVIVLLTVIFILIFLRISWKLRSVKTVLHENRALLLALEKTALLGRLGNQIEKSSEKIMRSIIQEIANIHSLFKQTESGLTREQIPEFKKIKETFDKAQGDLNNLQHAER